MIQLSELVLLVRKLLADPACDEVRQLAADAVKVDCAEHTCAVKPGRFCQFMGGKQFGQQPWCLLFDVALYTDSGWVLRGIECKRAIKSTRVD